MMKRHNTGKIGEEKATNIIRTLGHSILYNNLKLGYHEIDIISCKEGIVYIWEVKTTEKPITLSLLQIEKIITRKKINQLKIATSKFLLKHNFEECKVFLIVILPNNYYIFEDILY